MTICNKKRLICLLHDFRPTRVERMKRLQRHFSTLRRKDALKTKEIRKALNVRRHFSAHLQHFSTKTGRFANCTCQNSILRSQFRPFERTNFYCGICKHRVPSWSTPRAVLEIVAGRVVKFGVPSANFRHSKN